MMNRGNRKWLVILAVAGGLLIFFKLNFTSYESLMLPSEKYVVGKDNTVNHHHRFSPLIFIGGVPRSGTTLMRAMLDAHPSVRCGPETRIIPRIIHISSMWLKSKREVMRLEEAGISQEVINSAIAAFCLEIIIKHSEPAERLCNKDPILLIEADYLSNIFPNSKFIFMVRDGRATVHSIITRQVTITRFNLTSYRDCLTKWNQLISKMHDKCLEVGQSKCMIVYYEQLVLHPAQWLSKILDFLSLPWNDAVLHHEDHINKPGGVPLSKLEKSSDQVIKPVNIDALTRWVGAIPEDVVRDMASIAPMLSRLGYDPAANPPNYGSADPSILDNTNRIRAEADFWHRKALDLMLESAINKSSNSKQTSDEPDKP